MNTLITIFLKHSYTFGAKREIRYIYPPLSDIFAQVSLPNEAVLDGIGEEPTLLRFSDVVIPDQRTLEVLANGGSIVLYDGNLYSVETVRSRPNDFSISLICKKEERYQPHQFLSLTAGDSLLVAGDDILGTGDPLAGGEIDAPEPSGGAPDTPGTPGRPPTTGSIATDEQIDSRIRAIVDDRAEAGNSDRWPLSKLDEAVATDDDLPTPRTDEEIDARIATPARAGNTERWDYNKLPTTVAKLSDIPTDGGGGNGATSGLTESEVDARIADQVLDFAEGSKTARAPKSRLPTDTVYDADIENLQTQAQVDARVQAGVADFAETGNTDRIDKAKLPSDTAYDSDIRTNAEIDARIATFARQGATIQVPDAQLPPILRGLPSAFGSSGQVLQVNSGATGLEFATPASGGSGGAFSVDYDIGTPATIQRVSSNTARSLWSWTPTASGSAVLYFNVLTVIESGNFSNADQTAVRLRRTRASVTSTVHQVILLPTNRAETDLIPVPLDYQANDSYTLEALDLRNTLGSQKQFSAQVLRAYSVSLPATATADASLPLILRGLPTSFGTAGQVLQVNSGTTALEFADAASGGGSTTITLGHQYSFSANTEYGWTRIGTYSRNVTNTSSEANTLWSWSPTTSGFILLSWACALSNVESPLSPAIFTFQIRRTSPDGRSAFTYNNNERNFDNYSNGSLRGVVWFEYRSGDTITARFLINRGSRNRATVDLQEMTMLRFE